MPSSRRSASVLLASLLLQWTFAWSHFATDQSEVKRIKKDLAFEARNKAEKILTLGNDVLTLLKDAVETVKVNNIRDVAKSLSVFAGLAPGIGAVASSFINMVLIMIPQDDPVLNEVKKGFAEVNRKLDSLSIQVSNLATDVEWFNYASVYSRDEVAILNAWQKFNDLRLNSNLVPNVAEKLRLAEIFASYYENSGAESSVYNLYRYLTVNSTSLSENLNSLLKKKFKCDIFTIGRYHLYFSSLLWKGMALNQFYWKLLGFDTATKEAEHVKMLDEVFHGQLATIDFCKRNFAYFMKNDVVEIAKGLGPHNKTAVALKVKEVLKSKFSWYDWVVVVYNKADRDSHIVFNATEIDAGEILVLVGFTRVHGSVEIPGLLKKTTDECFQQKYCSDLKPDQCMVRHENRNNGGDFGSVFTPLNDYARVTHASYGGDFVEVPAPLYQVDCYWSYYGGKVSVHYSRKTPVCDQNECGSNGDCKRVLDSNQWFCQCKNGYYGAQCEKHYTPRMIPDMKNLFTPVRTVQDGLKILINSRNFPNHR